MNTCIMLSLHGFHPALQRSLQGSFLYPFSYVQCREIVCPPTVLPNNLITSTYWRKCSVQCFTLIAHHVDNLFSVFLNLRVLLGMVGLIQYIYPFSNSTNLQENLEYFGKTLQLISVSH